MSWLVRLDFDNGSGWQDITDYVETKSFKPSFTLHKSLKSTVNSLSFDMHWNQSIVLLLLDTDYRAKINVQKDGADYFTGYVRNNLKVRTKFRPDKVKIECVDPGYLLKEHRIDSTFLMEDVYLSSSDTSRSAVYQIAVQHGPLAAADISDDTINFLIRYKPIIANDFNAWELLHQMFFEAGYVWNFDASGVMQYIDLFPTFISIDTTFSQANRNIVNELEIERKEERREGAEVRWNTILTNNDAIVFNDSTGGDDDNRANIELAPNEYYPEGAGERNVYSEYEVDGREIITVKNARLSLTAETGITSEFTNYHTRGLIKLQNTASVIRKITKLQVYGEAIVRGNLTKTRYLNVTGTHDIHEVDAEYIHSQAAADRLAVGVANWYKYGPWVYSFRTKEDVEIGDEVAIDEDFNGIDINARVVEVVKNEFRGDRLVRCEGISAFAADTTTNESEHIQPPALPAGLTAGLTQDIVLRPTYASIEGGEIVVASYEYPSTAPAIVQCTGEADDVDIQAAINDLSNDYGGGKVKLTRGVFNLDGSIDLPDNIKLEGDGLATVLRMRTATSRIEVNGGDTVQDNSITNLSVTRVRSGEIDGGSYDTATFTGTYDGGVPTTTFTQDLDGGTPGSTFSTSDTELIFVNNTNGMWIIDCVLSESYGAGIWIRNSERITVRGNRVNDCDGTGMVLEGAIVDGGSPSTTTFAEVWDGGTPSVVSTEEVSGGAPDTAWNREVMIQGNFFTDNNVGIDIEIDEGLIYDNSVTGNIDDGIRVAGSDVHIHGNQANRNGGDGITLVGARHSVNGLQAKNNTDAGLRIGGSNTLVTGCLASGNATGFLIASTAEDTVLTGNQGVGNTTNRQNNGTNTTESGNVFS